MAIKNNNPGRILKGTKTQPTLKGASGIWTLDEAMQYHRANQWPVPNLYQPVAGSLRFKRGPNSTPGYLTTHVPRDGNRRTWTWSGWIKVGNYVIPGGSIYTILEGFSGASNSYALFYVNSSYQLQFGNDDNDGSNGNIATSSVIRDTTAWYHVMLVVDTTQATNTNRVKIYLNGVQQTLSGTWPVQNYAHFMGAAQPSTTNTGSANNYGSGIRLASRWNTTYNQDYDGLMSEVYFVDGYALQPTLVGQYDSTGVWVPVPYTGSYGTNGYYLPFTNTQTSQTLGYDASLNSTPTYNADQDPYRGSVVFHADGNGAPGAQNNSFIDSSANGYLITKTGSVTQGSLSPYPLPLNATYNPAINGASGWFDGSSGYLSLPSAAGTLGTGSWAIECWWKASTSSQTNYSTIISKGIDSTGAVGSWSFGVQTSTGGLWFAYASSANSFTNVQSSNSCNDGSWHHLAVTLSGTTLTLYMDGVSQTTATTPGSYNFGGAISNSTLIGYNTRNSAYINGYVAGLRVTVGSVIYTSAFTPTNKPFGTLTNNLFVSSENFTWGSWTLSNATLTTNNGIAPDGTPSATTITSSGSPGFLYIWQTLTAATYTFSTYAQAGTTNSLRIDLVTSGYTAGASITFNLTAGTAGSPSYYGSTSGFSSSITSVGNGWYRCSITGTTTATTWYTQHAVASGLTVNVWGAQLEIASTPGNYTSTPANYSTAPLILLNFANAAVVDSTGSSNILTVGSATTSTAGRFGAGALELNYSTADYFSINTPNSLQLYANNWTIECWFNQSATTSDSSNQAHLWFINGDSSAWAASRVYLLGNNVSWFSTQAGGNSSWYVSGQSGVNITNGVWYHLAVTRYNNTMTMWLNGVAINTVSMYAGNMYAGTINQIGGIQGGGGSGGAITRSFTGQIDDFRITNGVARYQAPFTPPARSLPTVGGRSFIPGNSVNAGIVKTFTSASNTSTLITSWTAPSDVTQIEVLVVAGGGGGGVCYGGGGGAGGVIYNNAYQVTPNQTYTIQVGRGGTNQVNVGGLGGNGTNSSFGNLVAIGGGGGGGNCGTSGLVGGSGGGGSGTGSAATVGGNGTAGQGFSGNTSGTQTGGGGGGAGGGGITSTTGSNGLQFGIVGTPTYYAGGGTAGQPSTTAGGLGGGGSGGTALTAGVADATPSTGGGGGGSIISGTGISGIGGSGIVIIRYTTATANSSDSTTDNSVDSPTQYGHDFANGGEVVGNYCTWNPVDNYYGGGALGTMTWLNGNLTLVQTTGWYGARATLAYPSYGQWYYEVRIDSGSGSGIASGLEIGIAWASSYPSPLSYYFDQDARTGGTYAYRNNGYKGYASSGGGTEVAYGSSTGAGDVIGIAYDAGAGNLTFYKNGVSMGVAFTGISNSQPFMPAISLYATIQVTANFGQHPWAFSPPQGYQALNTKNFQRPSLTPNQYFDVVTYTGTGSALSVTGLNFQPDFVWIKNRDAVQSHCLFDSIRGVRANLFSNLSNAENVEAAGHSLVSFDSAGFSVGLENAGSGSVNTSTNRFVAFCWQAGGAAVSNTNGSVTSQVSANTASGFSIVSYAGSQASAFTIGHGLNSAPSIIIAKARNATTNWGVYYTLLGTNTNFMTLNSNASQGSNSAGLAGGAFLISNATTLQIDPSAFANGGSQMIAYCWTSVPGYSSIGAYTGNGSADGPFVYTGFRPRYIMVKNSSATGTWEILDTARFPLPQNPLGTSSNNELRGENNVAESSGPADNFDFLSNGFKIRSNGSGNNTSGNVYIYMAFAQVPFGNTNTTAT